MPLVGGRIVGSGRDQAMQMNMMDQGLPPGVQDSGKTQQAMKVALAKFEQHFRDSTEEEVIEAAGIQQSQGIQGIRQGENGLKIGDRQQAPLFGFTPGPAASLLTARTVPVAAAVVVRTGKAAMGTIFQVAP